MPAADGAAPWGASPAERSNATRRDMSSRLAGALPAAAGAATSWAPGAVEGRLAPRLARASELGCDGLLDSSAGRGADGSLCRDSADGSAGALAVAGTCSAAVASADRREGSDQGKAHRERRDTMLRHLERWKSERMILPDERQQAEMTREELRMLEDLGYVYDVPGS